MIDFSEQRRLLEDAISHSGDDLPAEIQLLLWFLRHVMVVDELDAYDPVVDDPASAIDGLLIERSWDASKLSTLHVFESKFPETTAPLRGEVVYRFSAAADQLRQEGLEADISPELRRLGLRDDVNQLLQNDELELQPTLIAASPLSTDAQEVAKNLRVRVYALERLADLAAALQGPGVLRTKLTVFVARGTSLRNGRRGRTACGLRGSRARDRAVARYRGSIAVRAECAG